jgi:hypothetical protein
MFNADFTNTPCDNPTCPNAMTEDSPRFWSEDGEGVYCSLECKAEHDPDIPCDTDRLGFLEWMYGAEGENAHERMMKTARQIGGAA